MLLLLMLERMRNERASYFDLILDVAEVDCCLDPLLDRLLDLDHWQLSYSMKADLELWLMLVDVAKSKRFAIEKVERELRPLIDSVGLLI